MPEQFVYKYGTAGFRYDAGSMSHVAKRMAHVLAEYASKSYPLAVGLMFTASHNPVNDNGIKMIGPDGLMAPSEWESLAELIVNSTSFDGAIPFDSNQKGTVIIGRDTRPSGPQLISEFKGELARHYPNIRLLDLDLVTTPQLHFVVKQYNQIGDIEAASSNYFRLHEHLVGGLLVNAGNDHGKIMIDCANGVGAVTMRKLIDLNPKLGNIFQLVNTEGCVNSGCGSDHVKTTGRSPLILGEDDHNSQGASFDGDADRIVFWYGGEDGTFKVLDGDKIAALWAVYFARLHGAESTAVVQTAYANGASRDFLSLNRVKCVRAKTGVKNLHAMAEHLQINEGYKTVIYFESNGHGTVLSDTNLHVNECTGDAISDLLFTVNVLQKLGYGRSIREWDRNMYTDRPCTLTKIPVKDRSKFVSDDGDEGGDTRSPRGIAIKDRDHCIQIPARKSLCQTLWH